jgi:hypothetical protein
MPFDLSRLIACLQRNFGTTPPAGFATYAAFVANALMRYMGWEPTPDGHGALVQSWMDGTATPDAEELAAIKKAADACERMPRLG